MTFDGVDALREVDLRVGAGETVGLIGPNGAGKSTLINVATGFLKPTQGAVVLQGVEITRRGPEARARMGLVRSFQAVRPFGRMTVRENLEVSALACGRSRKEARTTASELIEGFSLAHRADSSSVALPAGEQRRLGVLRALASRPRFILLDEPAAGLDEDETQEFVEFVRHFRESHRVGLLIIEHDMSVILPLCNRVQVLNFGQTLAMGTPKDVMADREVRKAYLGSGVE